MSTDNTTPERSFRVEPRSLTPIASGMSLPPLRKSNESDQSANMSPSVARAPVLPFLQDAAWKEHRPLNLLSRPRTQTERIELPSIRQAVPEIQMRSTPTDPNYRIDSTRHSPVFGSRIDVLNQELVMGSSQKRRRTSIENEEAESRLVEQRSRSPLRSALRNHASTDSPSSSSRRMSIASINNSRSGSTRTSPHSRAQPLPAIRSSPVESSGSQRQEWRPSLPGIPSFNLDRGSSSLFNNTTTQNYNEPPFEASRSGAHTYPQHNNAYEPPSSHHHHGGYPQNHHGQARGQSYSGPSGRDRTPFSATSHHYSSSSTNYPYGIEMAEPGSEGKQRKRRGNLPKETTDKLRAWFHAHIQHPYPTEDEKQELMRQTGLQMNQISNWFINARRRQLPAMINNARAESEARSARGGEQARNTNEYGRYRDSRSAGLSGESDDGGSNYGEEYVDRHEQRATGPF